VQYNTAGLSEMKVLPRAGTFSEDDGGGVFLAESIEGKSIDYKDDYQTENVSHTYAPFVKLGNSQGP